MLADALAAAGIPPRAGHEVMAAAAARYLAPFPPVTERSLTGGSAAGLADMISGRFGLRGGGFVTDAGGASSLAAISAACLAIAADQVDAAVAGGIDLGIDPYDLVTLATSGRLARAEMRVYDAHPAGFLPGEGCGAFLLMRTSDARAKGLPVYAEIVGLGSASRGSTAGDDDNDHPVAIEQQASMRLLAMRRAHGTAGIEPAEVQLIEEPARASAQQMTQNWPRWPNYAPGRGRSPCSARSARTSATPARPLARPRLMKAVLAIANGVLPPSTGVRTPHPMLRDGRASLRLPVTPEPWPAGIRHAAVAATGADGLAFHLILRGEPGEQIAGTKAPQLGRGCCRAPCRPDRRQAVARSGKPGSGPSHSRSRRT